MILDAIDKVNFINKVNIRALNINGYFNRFKSGTLTLYSEELNTRDEKRFNKEVVFKNFKKYEEKYIDFIRECYVLNNSNLIIDFYTNRLDEDAISKILEVLNKEEREQFLGVIENIDKENIYFKVMDKKVLDIIVKLSTRNIFFSTFYFLEKELTIWGNYNLKFPLFYNDDNIISNYRDIAKKCALNII